MKETAQSRQLQVFYQTLYNTWGQPHWWPARTRFEVIVGAYLTQNTAWTNVERALSRLRAAGVLNLPGIRNAPLRKLESMIRSAGYFRQKAKRLKIFVDFLDEQYGGSLSRMFAQPTEKLREELLALNGIGPETADSILLYAGQHAVFIVDTYTRRVLDRHSILPSSSPYEEIRSFCEDALVALDLPAAVDERDLRAGAPGACHAPSRMSLAKRSPLAQVYNQMHGFIVGVGKNYCLKSKPRCEQCPLQAFLPKPIQS